MKEANFYVVVQGDGNLAPFQHPTEFACNVIARRSLAAANEHALQLGGTVKRMSLADLETYGAVHNTVILIALLDGRVMAKKSETEP